MFARGPAAARVSRAEARGDAPRWSGLATTCAHRVYSKDKTVPVHIQGHRGADDNLRSARLAATDTRNVATPASSRGPERRGRSRRLRRRGHPTRARGIRLITCTQFGKADAAVPRAACGIEEHACAPPPVGVSMRWIGPGGRPCSARVAVDGLRGRIAPDPGRGKVRAAAARASRQRDPRRPHRTLPARRGAGSSGGSHVRRRRAATSHRARRRPAAACNTQLFHPHRRGRGRRAAAAACVGRAVWPCLTTLPPRRACTPVVDVYVLRQPGTRSP